MMFRYYFQIIFSAIFVFAYTSGSDAQLINHERAKKRAKNQINLGNLPVISEKTIETKKGKNQETTTIDEIDISEERFIELISSQPKVKDRIERIYDLNRDGRLQKQEIIDLYDDVVISVQKRGSFLAGSDLLKKFDANNDGQISRKEAETIKKRVSLSLVQF